MSLGRVLSLPPSTPDDRDDLTLAIPAEEYWNRRATEGYLVRSPEPYATLRDSLALELLLEEIGRRGSRSILDLGCGPGDVLARIVSAYPEIEPLGVDPSDAFVELARERHPKIPFDRPNALSQVEPKKFDAVLIKNVLAHCDFPTAMSVLARAAAAVHAGGFVAVFEQTSSQRVIGSGSIRRSCEEYCKMLKDCGLTPGATTLITFPFFHRVVERWLIPIYLRQLSRRIDSEVSPIVAANQRPWFRRIVSVSLSLTRHPVRMHGASNFGYTLFLGHRLGSDA